MAKSSINKCGTYLGIEMCLSGAFAQGLSLLLPPVAGAWLGRDGECACRDSASSNSFLGGNVEHSCLDMAGRFLLEVQQIKGLNLSVSGWGRDLLSLQAVKSSQQPMVLKTKVGSEGKSLSIN